MSTPSAGNALAHPRVRDVDQALRAMGAVDAADGIRELPAVAPTAQAAADQLGCTVGAIANSLIFSADGSPLLVMTSGSHRVNTAMIAEFLGVGTVERATADEVRDWTGQAIGGVAPLGHPEPIGTLIDLALTEHAVIWAAAGHPSTVFPLTFDLLVSITDGTPVQVAP